MCAKQELLPTKLQSFDIQSSYVIFRVLDNTFAYKRKEPNNIPVHRLNIFGRMYLLSASSRYRNLVSWDKNRKPC